MHIVKYTEFHFNASRELDLKVSLLSLYIELNKV